MLASIFATVEGVDGGSLVVGCGGCNRLVLVVHGCRHGVDRREVVGGMRKRAVEIFGLVRLFSAHDCTLLRSHQCVAKLDSCYHPLVLTPSSQ